MHVYQLSLLIVTSNVVCASNFRCGFCPAGFFLNGCKNSTIPKCERCPEDSFKTGLNSLTQCTRCSLCRGRNNIEVRTCNETHDRECRCKKGYWYDSGAIYCTRCSTCRRGKGVERNCSFTADTQCKRCIRGVTFSPMNSGTEPCRICTKCGENEELVKLCTRRKDTECKPIPVKKEFQLKNRSKWPDNKRTTLEPTTVGKDTLPSTTTTATTTERTSPSTTVLVGAIKKNDSVTSDNSKLELALMVVGGILGFLFLAFLVILIIRHRRKTEKTITTQVVSAPYQPRKEPIDNRLSNTPIMHGSTDKLLRDVRYSLIDELSRNLNPKGRWKTLAGKLGFSSKDIENFELDPTNATATMLSHWAHHKGSTLHNLYDALKCLKWLNEADLVAKYMS